MKTLPRLVLLGTALCGLVLNTTPTPAASCVSRPAGLVAWWPGNGSTEDIVGTNNGTLHGATYAVGEAGQGFSFTGSGSAVSVTNTTALQLQDFTIEAWIKRASLTKVTMGIYQGAAFFCQSWGGYAFGIWDDGTLQLGKVGTSAVYSHFAVTDTNFHHVAVTKGGSNVVFYIDGVAEMADVPYDPGFVFSGPAAIGARGGDYANGFYGVIDEMSIYTRGLASSEVQSIYAASSAGKCVTSPAPVCVTPPSGLVAWWPGNGTAEDIVGTNNGTLDGVSFAPGKVGSGFNLTATRTGVSVGNPASLQLQDFTIETWIKRSSAETITLDVFSTAGFFTCYWGGYSLGIMSDGRLFLSKVGYSGAIATAAVTDTNFHHVAVSKAGSNVVIYLDGVGEVLAPYDPGFVFNGPSAIGSRGGDYYGSFYGLIDEMSIYNRGLSASEIQAIYNASSAGKCVTPASPANPNPDRLVWINPGTFTMGSPDTEQDRNPEEVNEGPQTQVTLTRGFFMGKYEVTQGEYVGVMGINPSYFTGNTNLPVETTTWNDATNYCALLTAREVAAGRLPAGWFYRLPTEAEWEYACRAGTTNRFSFGDDPTYSLLGQYAWYVGNSGHQTHPVGTKLPNPWGLYDMSGNVIEWCSDWYALALPGGSLTNYAGPASGTTRSVRGGNWEGPASAERSAFRLGRPATLLWWSHGFRVVLDVGQNPPVTGGCAAPASGLVAWWSGNSTADDLVGGHNGTLVNGVTYEPGMVGSAFRFGTASGQRVWVPDSPAFQLTNSLTIEGWFKIYGGTALVQRGDNRIGLDPYTFAVTVDGRLDFQVVHSDTTGDWIDLATSAAVPTNVWKHLAATLDGDTGSMRIYVDGQVAAQTNTTIRPLGPLDPAYDPSLGLGNCAGHSIEFPFIGLADEVGLYSRALSASEIQSIYTAGSAGKCFVPVGPTITSQPTNQTVLAGSSVSFAVAASGTLPLSYQWSKEGAPLSGATNASYTIAGVQTNDAGSYAVLVSNAAGSVPSSNALLSVLLPTSACAPPPADLVSWWAAAGNASDSIGTNNGTLMSGATLAAGAVGQGFSFNGTGSHVLIPDSASLDFTNELTIELWYKDTGASAGSTVGLIAKRPSLGACNFGINMVPGSAGYLHFYFLDPNHGSFQGTSYSPVPAAGVFHHLGASYRQAGADQVEVRIFIDGELVKTATLAGNLTRTVNNTPVTIGCSHPTDGEFFKGVIDEVSLYKRALSAAEIQSIYTASSAGKCLPTPPPACVAPPSGLVSWWTGNGTAEDLTGGNSGTLAGNTTYGAGRVGQGFVFDGSGDAVLVGNAANLQLQDFTVEAWIKRGSTSVVSIIPGQDAVVFSYGHGGYGVGLNSAGLPFLSKIGINGLTAGPAVTDTKLHHLAMAKAGTNVVFYVDGVGYAAAPYTSVFAFTSAAAVGARGDDQGNSFLGSVDEVSVYNRALSASEIQSIYTASSAGKCVVARITLQPKTQVGYWGKSVTFSVAAADAGVVSYQWLKDNVAIPGETNQTLTLSFVDNTDVGSYTVVLTGAFGTLTSAPATLTVEAAPISVAMYPGCTIDGVVGQIYGIQCTTDISNTNSWQGRVNIYLTTPKYLWYDSEPASGPPRYYRVVLGPISIP